MSNELIKKSAESLSCKVFIGQTEIDAYVIQILEGCFHITRKMSGDFFQGIFLYTEKVLVTFCPGYHDSDDKRIDMQAVEYNCVPIDYKFKIVFTDKNRDVMETIILKIIRSKDE